jgi:hypothetical protein
VGFRRDGYCIIWQLSVICAVYVAYNDVSKITFRDLECRCLRRDSKRASPEYTAIFTFIAPVSFFLFYPLLNL